MITFGRALFAACLGSLALFSASGARAALTFYPTRSAFNAANPGLATQSFNKANLFGQPYVFQASPLDHDTDDQVFTKGSIRKGIVITTAHPGETSTALIVFAGGPVSSKSVGNNWYGDTLILQFPKGVLAVGANVFGNTSSGTSFSGKISAHFFSGTKALGGMAFTESAGGYVFIGASSSAVPITSMRIQWASDEDATAYASDIIFGP